jgi:hypothetical protein
MKSILTAALALACPASVYATVIVRTDLRPPLSGFYLPGQTVSFDAYVENADPSQSVRLNAFTVRIDGQGFGDAPGLPRFLTPPPGPRGFVRYPLSSAGHPYVFADYLDQPDSYPEDPTADVSDADTVVITAALPGLDQGAEIGAAHSGLARLSIVIPPDAVPGRYPIDVVDAWTGMGYAAGDFPVAGQDTSIVIFPEPATLCLPCVAAPAALRRPRARRRL